MRNERGSAALEVVFITPALLAVVLLIVLCGRVVNAQMDVDAISRDAARAASVERTPEGANASAQAVVEQLTSAGRCRQATADVQQVGGATAGSVAVVVRCTVAFRDLAFLAVPTTKTFESRFVEPLDEYRGT